MSTDLQTTIEAAWDARDMLGLTTTGAVREAVDAPECGAVVVFHGVIRDHDGGKHVRALDYSAHPDAERLLAEVVADEQRRTGLRLAAVHRIGALRIGDAALVAAASAPHRAEAFAAIGRSARWKIAEPGQIEDGSRHYVEFSYRLDTAQLPRPMQIGIGGQADWTLSVQRTQKIN